MKEKFTKGFEKAKKSAEKIIEDKEAASKLLDEAIKKADNNSGKLEKVKDDLFTLIRMLKAWVQGQYKDIPWKTVISSFAAILYLVNPMDVIPDFIVGAGFLDDITILSFVFNMIRNDLEGFRIWESDKS